jgi:hypothetical protein
VHYHIIRGKASLQEASATATATAVAVAFLVVLGLAGGQIYASVVAVAGDLGIFRLVRPEDPVGRVVQDIASAAEMPAFESREFQILIPCAKLSLPLS